MGRATEISRDEVKFNKFVTRLRSRFNHLFLKALEKQLVLKQVITQDDWKLIAPKIKFDYAMDNYFAELKEIEILNEKVASYSNLLQTGAIGKYYSNKWVRKNIFRQDDELMKEMDEEIAEEQDNPQYNPPMEVDGQPLQGDQGGQPQQPQQPQQ
jgi:hypothetical protein